MEAGHHNMNETPQSTSFDQYRQTIDERMIALAAVGLTEDFYAIPLRKSGSLKIWLRGSIPLAQPGRRLQLELRKCEEGDNLRLSARLNGLLGMGLSGRRSETTLIRETRNQLAGVFDFGAIAFRITIIPYNGPHPVVAVAMLEQAALEPCASTC